MSDIEPRRRNENTPLVLILLTIVVLFAAAAGLLWYQIHRAHPLIIRTPTSLPGDSDDNQ